MNDLIDRQAAIDALHTWFRDGFDEDKWWNSTHVLAAIEGIPSAQQGYKWETCFECPLSHGCPKIKGCTNEQAIEYASQIPNDCPLSAQPDHVADTGKKAEGDCISRQKAIDALARMMPRSYTPDGSHPADGEIYKAQEIYADCIESIEILPAVQPEMIRCRDCKFAHITNDGRYCKYCDMFTDDYGQLIEMYFDSNFYCGYAERKTDE